MCYIPPGFWPRLIARLMAFSKRTLSTNVEVEQISVMHAQISTWFGCCMINNVVIVLCVE